MSGMKIAGWAIALLGLGLLIYPSIPGTSERDTAKIGPVEVQVETKKAYPVPPLVAAVILAAGAALVVLADRKKKQSP
jgi:hypothetical protein